MFDEPIAHLDVTLRAHMRSELKILQRKLGTPSEIYSQPTNKCVASFIGEPMMNFVDCDIIETDGQISLRSATFEASVLDEQAALIRANANGRQVSLGIRPDDISFALNGTAPTANGEVLIAGLLGGDILVKAQLKDARVTVKTRPDYPGQ